MFCASDASNASNASDFPDDADQSELSDYSDSSEWLGPPSDTFAPSKKRSQKHDAGFVTHLFSVEPPRPTHHLPLKIVFLGTESGDTSAP